MLELGGGEIIRPSVSLVDEDRSIKYDREINTNGHEYVDLGLPSGTLWATMNIGATSVDDPDTYCGDHFAWGETKSKAEYSWSTYRYCNGTKENITKYNKEDGLLELLPEDDAAHVLWGR